jgi:hypothetical protein
MLPVKPAADTLEATLREAAEWLAARLRAVSGVEVVLEDEPSWGIFAPTVAGTTTSPASPRW